MANVSTDLKLCPDCGEPSLSNADGELHCTNCGWSEEDIGHDPDLDENNVCRICGQYEPE